MLETLQNIMGINVNLKTNLFGSIFNIFQYNKKRTDKERHKNGNIYFIHNLTQYNTIYNILDYFCQVRKIESIQFIYYDFK